MDVLPEEAAGTSRYRGVDYYFCAVGCQEAFDKSPEQYATKSPLPPFSKGGQGGILNIATEAQSPKPPHPPFTKGGNMGIGRAEAEVQSPKLPLPPP